ncbi:hypothetical protein SAY86_031739 [Trapa natans]|uniref:Uncharacterized protein n=1 Tax=Trapa natans TaxID=22666 RepID=A0AAN7R8L1_TRANT|nr:hypothetical protein SAY86_031739 [Trapa natans]
MERKLVVILMEYMSKFGELEDCIVTKEQSIGRSCDFEYVKCATEEDTKAYTPAFVTCMLLLSYVDCN